MFQTTSMASKNLQNIILLYKIILICGLCLVYSKAELQRFEHPIKPDGSLSILVVGDWGRRGAYNQTEVAAQVLIFLYLWKQIFSWLHLTRWYLDHIFRWFNECFGFYKTRKIKFNKSLLIVLGRVWTIPLNYAVDKNKHMLLWSLLPFGIRLHYFGPKDIRLKYLFAPHTHTHLHTDVCVCVCIYIYYSIDQPLMKFIIIEILN